MCALFSGWAHMVFLGAHEISRRSFVQTIHLKAMLVMLKADDDRDVRMRARRQA
jgi:hypothetical protein